MPYSEAIIIADVSLPPAGESLWKDHVIQADDYDDWPDSLAGEGIETTAVERALDALQDVDGSGGRSFLDIEVEDGSLCIRGLLASEQYERWGELLAAITRATGEIGGVGKMMVADAHSADSTMMLIEGSSVEFDDASRDPMSDHGYDRVAHAILTRGGLA
jgi:hypothetical protein